LEELERFTGLTSRNSIVLRTLEARRVSATP
jgi:hypothetical protein